MTRLAWLLMFADVLTKAMIWVEENIDALWNRLNKPDPIELRDRMLSATIDALLGGARIEERI